MGMINLLFVFAGMAAGILTGLMPGLHVNTISLLLLAMNPEPSIDIALFIISMAVMHSFTDFIPSILLGAADETSFLSVLPGHRLLLKGKGLHAINMTIYGSFFGGIISIILIPFFGLFMLQFDALLELLLPLLLMLVLAMMVLSEERKLRALIIVITAGAIGFISLKTSLNALNPIFVIVTGFFGLATIINSIKSNEAIPLQETKERKLGMATLKASFLSSIAGSITAIIPGLGPSQSAFITRKLVGRIKTKDYLALLGGLNTCNLVFSIALLYFAGKTRIGAAAAIKQLMDLSFQDFLLIITVIIFSLGFSALIAKKIAFIACKKINSIEYKKLNLLVLACVIVISFFLTNLTGLLLLATTTAIGLATIKSGIRRSNLMAFLMVPALLYYLGL